MLIYKAYILFIDFLLGYIFKNCYSRIWSFDCETKKHHQNFLQASTYLNFFKVMFFFAKSTSMKPFFLKNLNTIVLIRFDSLLCKDGEGLKNGKIVFWIWSNTESGCMAYQLPRSPAFTLYRVTSVIGYPAIKSLLHLIATIFFSIRQKEGEWKD